MVEAGAHHPRETWSHTMQPLPRWTCAAALLAIACVRSAPREERESEPPVPECAELPAEREVPRLADGGLDAMTAADAGIGWMDMERIRETVRSHLPEVRGCREQQAGAYVGRIAARFVIAHSGQVCAARIEEATPREAALEQCLAKVVRAWRFPAPKGTGPVTVTYPFAFSAPEPVAPLEIDACADSLTLQERIAKFEDGGVDGGVFGALAKEEIRRVIRANISEVRECYLSGLDRGTAGPGKVAVKFVIADTGAVCAARIGESTVPDVAVGNCIVRAATRWQFPPPSGGGVVIVTYPFVFQ
jgi:TonB family protein